MKLSNAHNATTGLNRERPYGVRVSMKATDSLARVIGSDWYHEHWFATAHERDTALKDMASKHLYSRNGDHPSLLFEPIKKND